MAKWCQYNSQWLSFSFSTRLEPDDESTNETGENKGGELSLVTYFSARGNDFSRRFKWNHWIIPRTRIYTAHFSLLFLNAIQRARFLYFPSYMHRRAATYCGSRTTHRTLTCMLIHAILKCNGDFARRCKRTFIDQPTARNLVAWCNATLNLATLFLCC